MEITSGAAIVNGTNLYYERAGHGRTVVLIHGFSLDCRMWNDQFGLLAEHYHVLRYHLRGFGRSAASLHKPLSAHPGPRGTARIATNRKYDSRRLIL